MRCAGKILRLGCIRKAAEASGQKRNEYEHLRMSGVLSCSLVFENARGGLGKERL